MFAIKASLLGSAAACHHCENCTPGKTNSDGFSTVERCVPLPFLPVFRGVSFDRADLHGSVPQVVEPAWRQRSPLSQIGKRVENQRVIIDTPLSTQALHTFSSFSPLFLVVVHARHPHVLLFGLANFREAALISIYSAKVRSRGRTSLSTRRTTRR